MLENRFELEAPVQENLIDKEVLLYHQDYYEKWEELQEEVVPFICGGFFRLPRLMRVMFIH